jgi:hypothetical protein
VQKIKNKFVGVVVFEKKRFEAIVDSNTYTYERPWHKDRRRNSSVLKIVLPGYSHTQGIRKCT